MKKKGSYTGKILSIDLDNYTKEIQQPDEMVYRKYLGGSCLGGYYLLKNLSPNIDPLGPKNILIFSTSVTTGIPVPGFSRCSATSKSPLTGAIASSEAGGWFGKELKAAGFDVLIIKGCSKKPVYLQISNGNVEFKNADRIWGLFPKQAQKAIKEEIGEPQVSIAQIGPAGEKLVRYATICNDLRYFYGRSGLGAVMGSKNLKAIAVYGNDFPDPFDPAIIKNIAKKFNQGWKQDFSLNSLSSLGSAGGTIFQNKDGQLPTRNFQTGFLKDADKISGEAFDRFNVRTEGCFACPIRCKRSIKCTSPYNVDPDYGGPEYESVAALGSYNAISDPVAIAKANEICNKYGLDTISAGATISFFLECCTLGLLPKNIRNDYDLNDHDFLFGRADTVIRLLEQIGKREKIGDLLAEGSYRVAQQIGGDAKRLAMHVKGQELPAHEPRVKPSLGLAYAVSPTGAEHVASEHDPAVQEEVSDEIFMRYQSLGVLKKIPKFALNKDKVRFFVNTQKLYSFFDSLDICVYCASCYDYRDLEDIIYAATGWSVNMFELMLIGERRINLFRAFNTREGFKKENDCLPERMFEPITSGPKKGFKLDKENFKSAIKTYYSMMSFNSEGHPTRGKLEEIDLLWVADLLNLP